MMPTPRDVVQDGWRGHASGWRTCGPSASGVEGIVDCREVEGLLDADLDGELEPAVAASVRHHVDACAACRERRATLASLGRRVRRVPYYQVPEALRARLTQARTRPRATSHRLAWAAAVVMAASVTGSLWMLRSSARGPQTLDAVDAVAQEVVSSHVRALMGEHLFDVRSTDQHTVKPWFLGKVDFAPPVTDLAQAGFPLTGGRLDYVAGRPVAALVYTRGPHTINVFVWPQASDAGRSADARAIRGFHVRHWTRGGMSYWAVSDVNDADLDQFVHALQS
jgi:anti-sigma factor RsiW